MPEPITLTGDEPQLAYGALQELYYRAQEQDDSAPLTDEEEALRQRLQEHLGIES